MSTLYILKDGKYEPLPKDTIHKIKQIEAIKKIKQSAYRQNRTVRALAAWMLTIERRGLRMEAKDLSVTRLPNIDRLLSMCDETETALKGLKDV